MTTRTADDIREALGRLRASAVRLFEVVMSPYAEMAERAPQAAIGGPRCILATEWQSEIRPWADRVFAAGGGAGPLYQVVEDELLLARMAREYQRGEYSVMAAQDWLAALERARDAVLADVDAALEEAEVWQAQLAAAERTAAEDAAALWTPKDVASRLGLSESRVRSRIREARLGPWERPGGRWQIDRDAFLAFWQQQIDQGDLPLASTGAGRAPNALLALAREG